MSATDLTLREWDILPLVAAGMTNAEIGAQLYVSPFTVKSQLAALCHKLGARDRAHAVHIAHQLGLLSTAGMSPRHRYALLQMLLADPEVAAVMVAERGARKAVSL